jgi:hypothetical protein
MLDRVVAELAAEGGLTHIVLDDIELPMDSRFLETSLARIKTVLGGRGGQLVITSVVALPQRLSLSLALPATGTMSIPPFSLDEITEFLIARGLSRAQGRGLVGGVCRGAHQRPCAACARAHRHARGAGLSDTGHAKRDGDAIRCPRSARRSAAADHYAGCPDP